MATARDIAPGEIIPQMGFSPTQNQNGGWTASRDYYMLTSTWTSGTTQTRFAKDELVATADPTIDSLFAFLRVDTKSAIHEDSGTTRLTVNYTGSPSGQYGGENDDQLTLDAAPTYRLVGRLRELPLSEHPKWQNLGSITEEYALGEALNGNSVVSPSGDQVGNYVVGADNNSTFKPLPDGSGTAITLESSEALSFAGLLQKGIYTFQSPAFTWIETTQGDSGIPDGQLSKLGKVDTPRGTPPTPLGQGRDWMLTDAAQEQRGKLYRTSLEWTVSPAEGWGAFLYQD